MKNKMLLVAVLILGTLAVTSPAPKRVLTDIVAKDGAAGFSVAWPWARYAMEPFIGAAEYILSFTRYMIQLGSWMLWLLFFGVVSGLYKKHSLKEISSRILRFELFFVSAVIICLVFPFPAPRLSSPSNFNVCDFHSHTFYSHDGLDSPHQSLDYHARLGFKSFYDTEHGHTNGFDKFPADTRLKTVFPGMQVSTTERVSLLVLADRPFEAAPFLHKPVQEVIGLAHASGFMVVCPHWWKWRYFTWQQLYEFGIDGFEIYNAGYRKFPPAERRALIDFCKTNNLLMTGSTDWHGWGYLSNVWTAVENENNTGTLPFDALRKHASTKVIVLERPGEIQGTLRYFFEPFFGCYYYFGSLNRHQAFSWGIWIILFALTINIRQLRPLVRLLPLMFSAVFAGFCVWSIIIWVPLLPENQVIGKLLAPIFLGIATGWLYVYRPKNRKT